MVSVLSLKVLLISSGVLFIGLVCKISVPLVLDFSTSQAPVIWSSFLSWLKPPYLYVIINGIIITIVASSRFYKNHENDHHQQQVYEHLSVSKDLPDTHPLPYDYEMKMKNVPMEEIRFGDLDRTVVAVFDEKSVGVVNDGSVEEEEESVGLVNDGSVEEEEEDGENNEFVLSKSTWAPPPKRMDSSEIPSEYLSQVEKPLVSARFYHRKPVKASPEGARALRVSKPKRQETLESTWKAITEGRAMPLTRHLKKSDTWENHGRQVNVNFDPSPVKKSETFKDRTNYQSPPVTTTKTPSPLKLRREPSLSQDELNRRVEAFINKFNEEMRLQRQESLNQYKEMINRGTP